MLSSFKTRFRPVIWFLIFTFIVYSTPAYLQLLSHYELRIFFTEAEAAEEPNPTPIANSNFDPTPIVKPDSEAPLPKDFQAPVSMLSSSSPDSDFVMAPSASFTVDDFTGAAHLSYPIIVPPARNGLSPNLLLNYSSSAGNGWIGVGWDLSLGWIQRRGPRKAVPKYDTTDVFEIQIGGAPQELVCVNCPSGNPEYRLKIEGASLKITYYPDGMNGNHWEVFDKSGTKMTFGSAAGSRIGRVRDPGNYNSADTYRWYLDRVDDPKTDYMEFFYWKDQDTNYTYQVYPQEIRYNGQVSSGLAHNHQILFTLESPDRPDSVYNGRGGFKMWTRKRLSIITINTNINVNSTLVRKYQLSYDDPVSNPNASNARSLLHSVTVVGNDLSTLPPTVFTYQHVDKQNSNNRGFGGENSWSNPSNLDTSNQVGRNLIRDDYIDSANLGTCADVIDLNGNALPDRVVYDITSPWTTWTFYSNGQGGFGSAANWTNPSAWNSLGGNLIRNYDAQGFGTYTDLIDMNGDGFLERVVYAQNFYTDSRWKVYPNTGSGFDSNYILWPNPSAWDLVGGNYIRNNYIDNNNNLFGTTTDVIDLNGDGLPDRVVYNRNCTSLPCPWKVFFNNGQGFDGGANNQGYDWPNPSAWDTAPTNGNLIRNVQAGGIGTYADLIDMNGDGLPDRVVYDKDYHCTNPPSCQPATWKVYLNTGSGFDSNYISWANPSPWDDTRGNYIRSVSPGFGVYTDVFDVNGDGLPDRVVYDKTNPYTTWSVYYNKGPVADLLSGVQNEVGGTIQITYAPSTDYDNTGSDGKSHLPFVVQTVQTYTKNDGKGGSYVSSYTYSGGWYEPSETEFRGFKNVTSCQPNCNTYESKTQTTFLQDSVMKGKIQTQIVTSKEGHTKEVDNTWVTQPNGNGTNFPRLDWTISTVTDCNGGQLYTNCQGGTTYSYQYKTFYGANGYDIYFNVIHEEIQHLEGSQFLIDVITDFEYKNCSSQWILSKPTKITVSSASQIASRKWMDYDCNTANNTGNLLWEEVCKSDNPGGGACSNRNTSVNPVITYGYYDTDGTHNLLSTSNPQNPNCLTTITAYDSTKTHVSQTTNCLGHVTNTTYDPGTGNLLTLIPPHLQGTPYSFQTSYDAFGRKRQETRPDGGYTYYAYNDSGNAWTQYVQKIEHVDAGSFNTGWGGDPNDIPIPGDYDGDGKTDIAVYRSNTGAWWIILSSTGGLYGVGFGGLSGDIPVPGDYDGDGMTDIAIYRSGAWFIIPSSTGIPCGVGFGGDPSDIPVPRDYNGDGKTDIAIYRASTGGWFVMPSTGNGPCNPGTPYGVGFGGLPVDIPVPADYDGDGKADIAIYRSGAWFIIPSLPPNTPYGIGYGGDPSDTPLPGDYDGDGKTDPAVYRVNTATWWVLSSSGIPSYGLIFGTNPYQHPVAGDYNGDYKPDYHGDGKIDYNGDGKADFAFYISNTGGWTILPLAFGFLIDHANTSYFDGMGRNYKTTGTSSRTDQVLIRVDTAYDSIGRVFSKTNPYYEGTDTPYYSYFYYDGLARNTTTVTTDNHQIITTYQGLKKVVTNQRGISTAYTSDVYQRLVKVEEDYITGTGASYSTTEYAYDTLGNLIQVDAAKNLTEHNTTTMFFDSLSKKKWMSDPDMGYWTYDYDKSGNLTFQRDAKYQTTNFYYDDLNRLTQKVSDRTVNYTYDNAVYPDPAVPYSKGKLVKVSVSGVETNEDKLLEYDLMQRVKRNLKTLGTETIRFEKGYDSAGRMISQAIASVNGSTITPLGAYGYGYDVAGNLVYVKDVVAGMDVAWYSNFTALGQPRSAMSTRLNNAVVQTNYSYYPDTGRLHTLLTQKLVGGVPTATYQNLNYQQYDGKGNIQTLVDSQNNITHTYTYDNLDRLLTAVGTGTNPYSQSYTYDHIGNILTKSDAGSYSYSYNNKPHAVRNAGSIAAQYDANGNITSRTGGTINLNPITYNFDNKPASITAGTTTITFTYDGDGQRARKISPSQTVVYFGGEYEKRITGTGTVAIIHLFARNQRVASIRSDGKDQYYHTNHLGSASVITDPYGDRKQQVEYFPFGAYRAQGSQQGTYDFDPNYPNVNYTFTGQEDDDDLGLYNYGARLYDPVLGRFVSPDKLVPDPGDPQALNRYSYCLNNPLMYVDPSGNFFIFDDIIVALSSFLVTQLGVSAGFTAYTIAATATYGALSAAGGAALGAATAAIAGGDIGMGALTGAISGAMFYGAGNIIGGLGLGAGPTVTLGERAAMAGIHTAAGMISGGINSAITGSNIGLGVVAGGISAGTAEFLGGDIPGVGNKYADFAIELAGRSLSGGVTGGIAAEIYGGDFGHGFAVGAATGAAGFLFNKVFHYGTTLYRVGPNGQLTPIVENIPEGTDVTEPSDPLLNAYKQLMVTGAKFGVNQGLQRVGTQVLGMGLISSKIFFGASVGILFDLALPREAE